MARLQKTTTTVPAEMRLLERSSVFGKTKMCKFNRARRCTKGDACVYAHSQDEKRPLPDLYKTRYCFSFMKSGFCAQGELCPYAHQANELRQRVSQRQTNHPFSGFTYHAIHSTKMACQPVGNHIGDTASAYTSFPMQAQHALRRELGSNPVQDCQVSEVSSNMQVQFKGSHLLAERSLTSNDETILASPWGFQPSALRQGTPNVDQKEEEADHEWKALGFAIVKNTFLECQPQDWAQRFGAAQRSQSAGGRLESKSVHL